MARLLWEDLPDGTCITYASTNRWFRFALAWWQDQAFGDDDINRGSVSTTFDRLMPLELSKPPLELRPAHRAMADWLYALFREQSHETNFLIPCGLDGQENRHSLRSLQRMPDFLTWFPEQLPVPTDNRAYLDWPQACVRWATAAFSEAEGLHRVRRGIAGGGAEPHPWQLYDLVDVNDPTIRHSGPFKIQEYGYVARGLEHLSRVKSVDPASTATYARFARESNWRMWQDRPLHIVSEVVSAEGHRCGDRVTEDHDPERWVIRSGATGDSLCTADTDVLYWVRAMYENYDEAGGRRRRDLKPPFPGWDWIFSLPSGRRTKARWFERHARLAGRPPRKAAVATRSVKTQGRRPGVRSR